jgi:hypothetical protein
LASDVAPAPPPSEKSLGSKLLVLAVIIGAFVAALVFVVSVRVG